MTGKRLVKVLVVVISDEDNPVTREWRGDIVSNMFDITVDDFWSLKNILDACEDTLSRLEDYYKDLKGK